MIHDSSNFMLLITEKKYNSQHKLKFEYQFSFYIIIIILLPFYSLHDDELLFDHPEDTTIV